MIILDKLSLEIKSQNHNLVVFGDEHSIRRAMINLLSNAIKFTHENGEVSLSISYNEKKHTYNFAVKDNGIGLSEADTKKLFQAFTQVDNIFFYKYNIKST